MKQFPLIFSGLWLTILCVMLWAGFWQLGRADEKAAIQQRLAVENELLPQTTKEWQQLAVFSQVRLLGRFLDTHILLDNQIMDGQVGHFVFTAFETINQQLVLINRGWTDEPQQNFSLSDEQVELSALTAAWPRPGFQLGEQTVAIQQQQHLTYMPEDQVSTLLQERHCEQKQNCIILPLVLKLNPDMAFGFARNWQLPRMTVEKHRAYAAQWFTMSLVLCLVYGVFLRKTYYKKS